MIPLELELQRINKLSQDCEEANVEENDHTVYSYDDLEYEYGLAKESVTKKLGFLENQVINSGWMHCSIANGGRLLHEI